MGNKALSASFEHDIQNPVSGYQTVKQLYDNKLLEFWKIYHPLSLIVVILLPHGAVSAVGDPIIFHPEVKFLQSLSCDSCALCDEWKLDF